MPSPSSVGASARRPLLLLIAVAVIAAVVTSVVVTAQPSSAAPSVERDYPAAATLFDERPTDAGPVEVDPALREQVEALEEGETVQAVITTWTHDDVAAVAEDYGIQGPRLDVLPMILAMELTGDQFGALVHGRDDRLRSIWSNTEYDLLMEDTTWITGARYVWGPSAQGGLNVTGADVELAIIDTGAEGRHEDMDNLVEYCETLLSVTSTSTTTFCSPFDPASDNAGPIPGCELIDDPRLCSSDDEGHGSHVLGTVAGSGEASGGIEATHSTIGIAPDAQIHMYSANIGPALLAFEILSSYDDIIDKKDSGLNNTMAVNNSWGGGTGANYNPDDPIHVAVNGAYDVGVLSVFAAGNSGPEHNTLSRQCVNPHVVCVAASTKPDSVVMFSSRGRPSEPADTNRNGIVHQPGEPPTIPDGPDDGTEPDPNPEYDPGDVAPDNHDRALAQAKGDVGLYRPTLSAPGVNIFSIAAESGTTAACWDEALFGASIHDDCYVAFNGTSMATPHVTGAVGLIVQAYRQGHGGADPTPAIITDILERSANVSKLPGWETEEQGAGRLNVQQAVLFAQGYPAGLPQPNLGAPSPPFADGLDPRSVYLESLEDANLEPGCAALASYSTNSGYGEHLIDVPANAERLRITVAWETIANLYIQMWRPGVAPGSPSSHPEPGPERVFPDQESLGLIAVITQRWADVRAPEPGEWVVRVYHRVGTDADCTTDGGDPGVGYTLRTEIPISSQAPTVNITSPATGETFADRFVPIEGTAAYPTPWDGISNWEVREPVDLEADIPSPDNRTVLHMQGNIEEGCTTADGAAAIIECGGPFLREDDALSASTPASWKVPNPIRDCLNQRCIFDPNWIWELTEPTSVYGVMTLEWWASCGACQDGVLSADWDIQLWTVDTTPTGTTTRLAFDERITATPALPETPDQLTTSLFVHDGSGREIRATTAFVLVIDPVYIDSQNDTKIYYDSQLTCGPGAAPPCDSIVRMPVGPAPDAATAAPANLRVTDVHDGLRISWDDPGGAALYEIYRSQTPIFSLDVTHRIAVTGGSACTSPDVPSWPTASRGAPDHPSLCFTDTTVEQSQTYYYRVVNRGAATTAEGTSNTAYGMATQYDRQVKVKADRLFGPQYWDYATLTSADGTTWEYSWDTLEVPTEGDVGTLGTLQEGDGLGHVLSARSFTQGIGSTADTTVVVIDEPAAATSPPAAATSPPAAATTPPASPTPTAVATSPPAAATTPPASPTHTPAAATASPSPSPRVRFIPDTAFEWATRTPEGIATSTSLLVLLGSAGLLAAPALRRWLRARR